MSMDYRVGGNLDGITVDAGNLIVHPESLDRPHDSCVLWLRMNEGSGATASDFSGYGNHGTLGAGAAEPTLVAGKYGNALSFDGGDKVAFGNPVSLTTQGARTVSFWIKSTQLAGNKGIVAFRDSASSYGISFIAGQAILYLAPANYRYWVATDNVFDGLWHHVIIIMVGAAQSDITNAVMYVDGSLITAFLTEASAGINSWTFHLLGLTGYGSLNGILDEVRIYNRALTAAEIMKLYLDEH